MVAPAMMHLSQDAPEKEYMFMTILVIDNNRGDRHLIDTIFRHKGYEVLLAENGEKGLELFRQEHPDVIILDLKLDEVDGLTVLRNVRSFNPSQRVIIYSGSCDPKTEQQLLAFGITEMVKKGCSLDHLEEALQHALMSSDPGGAINHSLNECHFMN
jgi:CheY-like chemotaxis protein